jgi:putative transposase
MFDRQKGGNAMYLIEQHMISKSDPRFAAIDAAAFASENLYNAANYEIRQAFTHEGQYLTYTEVQRCIQSHEACKALPAKDVLRSIVPKNLVLYNTRFMELPAGFFGSSSSPGDHTVRCGSSLTLCGSGLRVAERSR